MDDPYNRIQLQTKLRYQKIGVFERPLKVKKNGVFIFVISHIIPINKLVKNILMVGLTLCKVENISASNDAKQLELGKHVVH